MFVWVFLFSLAAPLAAQVSSGAITGIVTDASQARLPRVALKLTNVETGVAQAIETNDSGEYTFPLLNSGRYTLTAEATGFQTHTRNDLTVELGRTLRIDIAMTLGSVQETVSVTGAAPLLESETSTVGQFIENKTIADMPLNGRRVGELLGLAGSAVFIQGDVIRPRVTLSGGRADQQQWMLDGVNASNIALEVPQALFNPPVESVQEIRIQQNGYSAEYGNSSAGVILTTTKSGTNQLHGTAYEYFRNDKLDARNFFAADRPPLRWNVFGFSLGGPVVLPKYNGRNRTFFFTSLEWQRQRIGVVRLLTVPTVAERAGDFSRTTNAAGATTLIYDPNSTPRAPFPGNRIPADRLDPVGRGIAQAFGVPNRAPANLAGAQNFVANAVNALNITTWTSKVDHVLSDKDRVSVRYVLHDFPAYTTAVFEPGPDPNAATSERTAQSVLVNEIHTFTPTLINDFRFNWQPRFFINRAAGIDEGWISKLGLKGVEDRAFPRVTPAGYTALGLGTHERVQRPIWDMHIVNGLSHFRGAHSLKYGGEARWGRNVDIFNQLVSGSLNFAVQTTGVLGTANTGNAIASMLLGMPSAGSIQSTLPLDRRSWYYAFYVQDDWKATRNLTLNLGVRWETHTPRTDAENRQNGFSDALLNPVSGTPGVITFAGRDGVGRTLYDGDYNNIAPRIGLAWKPWGSTKTVVRAAYGIFFGPPLPGSNNTSAGFEVAGDFQSPDNGITPAFLLRNGYPGGVTSANLDRGFGAVRVGQAVRYAPQFIDQKRQLGYSQQWNLIVQREVGWNTLIEAGYVANVGHKLNGPNTSVNQVPPALMGAGNAQIRRPFPQFGNVVSIAPMFGNSSYHGLNVKLEKRFSNGFNVLSNYTFSKFIDDVAGSFENGNIPGGAQNLYDRRSEKALSGNDVRNRFNTSAVYELPWGRGRRWLSKGPAAALLGGWNIGAIVVLQDGSPNGITTQVNSTNAFTPGPQRVNLLRDPSLPEGDRTVGRWFDTTAVAAPAQFTFGNAGRALFTGPGLFNLDMSLLKNFAITERWNVQFRAESFNVVNRANFEDPNTVLGSPVFGVIGAARPARSVQLGLRLSF
ncbi:MAG: TonB-dependent receptor [Bryobacterales bacterium]|nr:TonB-dependent receptor [Bryobacterales bacterium]